MTVRLLDVTLREAGLANGYAFTARQAAGIVAALARAGVDIIELGYRRPALAAAGGAACPPAYIAPLRAVCARAELAVMVHLPDVTLEEYARLRDDGIGLVRLAVAARELGALAGHARAARAAGLRFTVNLTRATEVPVEVVLDAARAAEDAGAACFYVADSNGSLYPDRVGVLTARLRDATRIALGFHAHDNLRLAFANTLIALRNGCSWIDASLGGAGKGGGNLILELVAGHLGVSAARRLDVFALARAYAEHVAPAMPPERRGCQAVFGLLDYNMDQIAELAREAERRGVSLESLVAELYDLRTRGAPAVPTTHPAPAGERSAVS
jgi:4-hydroxy 2-oxovalerate aldolase